MNVFTQTTRRITALIMAFTMVVGVLPNDAAAVALPDGTPACSVIIASNAAGDNPTEGGVATYVHDAWTDAILGATWLWSDATVTDPTVNMTKNFSQTFIWGGDTITNLDMQFAADNAYTVTLNGTEIGSAGSGTDNHSAVTQLSIDPNDINLGVNTLDFEITNLGVAESNFEGNPAGFIFKLIIDGTGTTCDEVPAVDVCDNIAGDQVIVPEGYVVDGNACYSTNDGDDQCLLTSNLLANASFETPTVDSAQGWDIFDSVVNGLSWVVSWINSSENTPEIAKLELQNGRAASAGTQYAELDSNYTAPGEIVILGDARVKIAQSIPTVPGAEYTLTYDFSAVPGHGQAVNNKVQVVINGVVVDTQTTSLLPGATTTNWTPQSFTFTATTTTTEVALADAGRSDTFGTLIDNVSLTTCLEGEDDQGSDEDTYEIYGFVWDDTDEDDVFEEGEADLDNWSVRAVNASNSEEVYTDLTDATGRYSLNVPVGTWIISELTESGWVLLSDANGAGSYVVTVPEESEEMTFSDFFIPTASAATLGESGPYNFGNDYVGGNGGSGRRSSKTTPTGEVLGDATSTAPVGEILGASTTMMPVGAPNTGAGGTSAPTTVTTFAALVAVLPAMNTIRKSK